MLQRYENIWISPLFFVTLQSESVITKGMKLGFGRPLQHIWAGAPIYKGARPNSCGRAAETS